MGLVQPRLSSSVNQLIGELPASFAHRGACYVVYFFLEERLRCLAYLEGSTVECCSFTTVGQLECEAVLYLIGSAVCHCEDEIERVATFAAVIAVDDYYFVDRVQL